jgi:hypothetical protein
MLAETAVDDLRQAFEDRLAEQIAMPKSVPLNLQGAIRHALIAPEQAAAAPRGLFGVRSHRPHAPRRARCRLRRRDGAHRLADPRRPALLWTMR